MDHKTLTSYFLIAILLVSCNSSNKQIENEHAASKPHVLFLIVDDLRPELGTYGKKHIQSPYIDKLAQTSLVFDRAYCNIPVCGASRASLLSGLRPGRHRFLDFSTRLSEDWPGVVSLPQHFKANGYRTISHGKVFHHLDDQREAWDEAWVPKPSFSSSWRDYVTAENIAKDTTEGVRGMPYEMADVSDTTYFDGKIAQKAIEDLKKLKKDGTPFFMALGFFKPHLPFNAPSKYWDLYDTSNIVLPENYIQPVSTPKAAFHNFGELRNYHSVPRKGPLPDSMAKKLIQGYYACVSYTDAQIGKVLQTLAALELEKNTIVVLVGDHGWNLGDHQLWCKHCNFESSLSVPLILKIPGKTNGKHTSAITEYIDIYPTLCELTGTSVPKHTEGQSIVPLLNGIPLKKDFAIAKFLDGITLIKEDYFYTEWLDKNGQARAKMLFDHAIDPLEINNLAEQSSHKMLVTSLREQLRSEWGKDFFTNKKSD